MLSNATYDALREACLLEGCPICRLEHDADFRYLDRLLYEQVNDYKVRLQLRASLGFCSDHALMAMEELQGKALGLAIIYDDLLRVVLEQLDTRQIVLKSVKTCPACENRREMTGRVLTELSKTILQPAMQTALKASQGLCFGHLQQVLDHVRVPEKRKTLISLQREIMEKLRVELAEYIRKNDYRFTGEPFGPERDAWRRAVSLSKKD